MSQQSMSSRPGIHYLALALALLVMFLMAPLPAMAQGGGSGGGNGSGGGATAAADVVIKGLGLLTQWINGQNDNCAAASMAAVWGPSCGLTKDECTDTGFYSASCDEYVSNGCGTAWGTGYASESPVGMWAGYSTIAYAGAYAARTPEGKNGARGWGKASVDGTSKAKTRGSGAGGGNSVYGGLEKGASSAWPEGTVLAVLEIRSITLDTNPASAASSGYNGFFQVDGQTVWSASASLDPQGNLNVSGGLAPSDFSVTYDGASGLWTASLSGHAFEHYVGRLDPDAATAGGDTESAELTVHVHYESEVESDDEAGGDLATVDVAVNDATLVDNFGVPAYQGQRVHIVEPLVTLSDAAQLGRYLDTDAANADSGIGILDLHQDAILEAGDQLYGLTGTIYHDNGRTVLVDVQAEVAPGGAVPVARALYIGEVLAQAENLEGTLVTLQNLSLVDATAWPGAGRSGTVLVEDSAGEVFTLAIPLASGIGGSAPPAGTFDAVGILTQDDPEAPHHEGYQLRLRSAADLRTGDDGDVDGEPGDIRLEH